MEYMIFIGMTESPDAPQPGSAAFDEYMGAWLAYNQKLIDGGNWVGGASLQPTATATTIVRAEGVDTVLDGPFAETKEQLGGYYLVEAANLDEAIELAKAMPVSDGSLEIRPVAFRPDAPR